MTTDDVRALADEVLRPILGPVGFASTEVGEGENDIGEDALFVTVRFTPGSRTAEGRVYNDALLQMWSALQGRGEKRFAHLLWSYADDSRDEAELDEDDGSAP